MNTAGTSTPTRYTRKGAATSAALQPPHFPERFVTPGAAHGAVMEEIGRLYREHKAKKAVDGSVQSSASVDGVAPAPPVGRRSDEEGGNHPQPNGRVGRSEVHGRDDTVIPPVDDQRLLRDLSDAVVRQGQRLYGALAE